MPIIICCNKEFDIPYSEDVTISGSEYIKDVVVSFSNKDVAISIPDKYCTVIDNYVEFLKPKVSSVKGNQIPITSRERLLLCFQLNTLLIDENYFKYCVQQVFNNWSYMCNMVYNDFNDDLQWSFFVYCPYDFIPKYLLGSSSFMKQWNELNQGKIINVNNDNEVYYNNVETINGHNQKLIRTYHTVNVNNKQEVLSRGESHIKEVGYKKEILYYVNSNNIKSESYYVDNKKDGLWRRWYNDDQQNDGTPNDGSIVK